MKRIRLACAALVALTAAACEESDVTDPEVTAVRVEQGGNVVAEVTPSGLSDTTIMEEVDDLP
jgi:hypothetical protein